MRSRARDCGVTSTAISFETAERAVSDSPSSLAGEAFSACQFATEHPKLRLVDYGLSPGVLLGLVPCLRQHRVERMTLVLIEIEW